MTSTIIQFCAIIAGNGFLCWYGYRLGCRIEREECARRVEEYLIYTGPGGHDPEPIQKILAKMLRRK